MFTGIVCETGEVSEIQQHSEGSRLTIVCTQVIPDLEIGASISIDGVCLTVETLSTRSFSATATPETLRRSKLGDLSAGSRVNLEPALRSGEAMGGHLVQGHVDATGRVVAREEEGNSYLFRFQAGANILDHCVSKGSIAVDGVSLTICGLGDDWFEVAIIPHTMSVTGFADLKIGDAVNLEVDVISKYVQAHVKRILDGPPPSEHRSGRTV